MKLAGQVKSVRSEDGQWFLDLEVKGTRDEDLLRILSGRKDKLVAVHLCTVDCNQQLTDELLVHSGKFEEVSLMEESWMSNLKEATRREDGGDDLQELRREQARMEEAGRKAKTVDKKEAKRKKREEAEEGRPSKSPKGGEESREVGQRTLAEVFGGTGMDPNVRVRSKIVKRARKIAKKDRRSKKKKDKGSSSGSLGTTSSSSSSSSLEVGETCRPFRGRQAAAGRVEKVPRRTLLEISPGDKAQPSHSGWHSLGNGQTKSSPTFHTIQQAGGDAWNECLTSAGGDYHQPGTRPVSPRKSGQQHGCAHATAEKP